ncbi:hypothetical protein E2562_007804, partial [Oryza meyeriana var. granulata]
MAVVNHRGDKENVPPPASAAAAACRHGVAVKKLKLKRLGTARRPVPLRDITNLFVAAAADSAAAAAATEREAPQRRQPLEGSSEHVEAKFQPPPAQAHSWLAGGVALKPGRYSLRK